MIKDQHGATQEDVIAHAHGMSKLTMSPIPLKHRSAPLRTGSAKRHTHLRDVSDQSPVELVDGVTVQLWGVGDQLDQVGHRFIPHVAPCLAEWRSESNTSTHSISLIAGPSTWVALYLTSLGGPLPSQLIYIIKDIYWHGLSFNLCHISTLPFLYTPSFKENSSKD